MTITEFMKAKHENQEKSDISDADFKNFIIDYLLGKDWRFVEPMGHLPINEFALYQILSKYSKRYIEEINEESLK